MFQYVEGGQYDWVDIVGLQCIDCVCYIVLCGGDYWVGFVGVVVVWVLCVQYVEVQQVVGMGREVDLLCVLLQGQVVVFDWFVLFIIVVIQVDFVVVYLVVFLVLVVVWCQFDVVDQFVFVEVDYLFVCIGFYCLIVYCVELGGWIVVECFFQFVVGFFGWMVDYQQVVGGQCVVQCWGGWEGIVGGCGGGGQIQLQCKCLVDVDWCGVYMQGVVVFGCIVILVFVCCLLGGQVCQFWQCMIVQCDCGWLLMVEYVQCIVVLW